MKTFLMKYKFAIMLASVAVMAVCASMGVIAPLSLAIMPMLFGVTTTDHTGGHAGAPASGATKLVNIRRRVTIPLALQIATDVLQVVPVKAGWLIQQVAVEMVTPTTGDALTCDVGDSSDVDGFDAAVSLKGAAGTVTKGAPGTDAYLTAGGRFFTVDDTLDLKFVTVTNPAGAVVVDVIVIGVDTNV
jgi:hypothetical protein